MSDTIWTEQYGMEDGVEYMEKVKWIRYDIHEKAVKERDALKAENERLRDALEWAKPYVARLRDTEIIEKALQGGE